MEMIHLKFDYNHLGYGDLELMEGGNTIGVWYARSGSIDGSGKLVNVIEPVNWFLTREPEIPVESEANRMFVPYSPGKPWKERLWRSPDTDGGNGFTHYLIHPDGGKGGTKGCIGTVESNAMDLYYFLKWVYAKDEKAVIPLTVTKLEV